MHGEQRLYTPQLQPTATLSLRADPRKKYPQQLRTEQRELPTAPRTVKLLKLHDGLQRLWNRYRSARDAAPQGTLEI